MNKVMNIAKQYGHYPQSYICKKIKSMYFVKLNLSFEEWTLSVSQFELEKILFQNRHIFF